MKIHTEIKAHELLPVPKTDSYKSFLLEKMCRVDAFVDTVFISLQLSSSLETGLLNSDNKIRRGFALHLSKAKCAATSTVV